jgi:methionine aminopeptidase
LKKLNLHQEISFEKYDNDGYDLNRMPVYALNIPSDLAILIARLQTLFPAHVVAIETFINEIEQIADALDKLPIPLNLKYL